MNFVVFSPNSSIMKKEKKTKMKRTEGSPVLTLDYLSILIASELESIILQNLTHANI